MLTKNWPLPCSNAVLDPTPTISIATSSNPPPNLNGYLMIDTNGDGIPSTFDVQYGSDQNGQEDFVWDYVEDFPNGIPDGTQVCVGMPQLNDPNSIDWYCGTIKSNPNGGYLIQNQKHCVQTS